VPPAVHDELTAGRQLGLNLPDLDRLDWIIVRRPSSSAALPLVSDLGAGERELLVLALEPVIPSVFLMMLGSSGCQFLAASHHWDAWGFD
jgi:predicted nucleic acid-binding protein